MPPYSTTLLCGIDAAILMFGSTPNTRTAFTAFYSCKWILPPSAHYTFRPKPGVVGSGRCAESLGEWTAKQINYPRYGFANLTEMLHKKWYLHTHRTEGGLASTFMSFGSLHFSRLVLPAANAKVKRSPFYGCRRS